MDLKKLVMERGMKLLSNPRVMKLMSNPKVMKLVMQLFQLRGKAQASLDQRVKQLANTLHLATHDEITELRATIHLLESQLSRMQDQNSKPNGGKSSSKVSSHV